MSVNASSHMKQMKHAHSGVPVPPPDLNRPIRLNSMLHHTSCDFLPFSQDPSVPTLWSAFSAPSIPLSGDILLKMPCLTHLLVSQYIIGHIFFIFHRWYLNSRSYRPGKTVPQRERDFCLIVISLKCRVRIIFSQPPELWRTSYWNEHMEKS